MKTFLIADTHFGHKNILQYEERPFISIEEMHQSLMDNWNKTVSSDDKVYCLGDMSIARSSLKFFGELKGRKILIKGNHDIFKLKDYLPYFDDVRGSHLLDSYILSHIPIHPSSLSRWKGNIHGHLHSNRVKKEDGSVDPRYFCVSAEQINFAPIDFNEVKKQFEQQLAT